MNIYNRLLAATLFLCLLTTRYGQSEKVNESLEYFNGVTTYRSADRQECGYFWSCNFSCNFFIYCN